MESVTFACMETTRQQKVAKLLQKDLANILQFEYKDLFEGAMVTVTTVRVTKDLSLARVYLSIFGAKDKNAVFENIMGHQKDLRLKLGIRVKNQLRVVPDLDFFIDDSLDYIERIEDLLKQ